MVVGAVLDSEGRPLCCELWPGNTTDVKTLVPIVDRLKKRFSIGRVCIVADRGMISAATLAELEEQRLGLHPGSPDAHRRRSARRGALPGGPLPGGPSQREGKKDPSPLKVKEVRVWDRRYIVCLNEDQARKDAADREAIVEGLRDQLPKGDKSLVGNKGYRKFLKTEGKHFRIDEEKIREEARYDGKWVLRTNTDLPAAEVALKYKQLWMVEDIFRTMKSLLETRPIYHKCDETIRGHVFCSFLALGAAQGTAGSAGRPGHRRGVGGPDPRPGRLGGGRREQGDKRFLLRTEAQTGCTAAFRAAGVALPPTVRAATRLPA